MTSQHRPLTEPGGTQVLAPEDRSVRGILLTAPRLAILAGCAVLGIFLGIGGQALTTGKAATPAPTASASTTTAVAATVRSFDPKGSGFTEKATDSWKTQSYRTADFGNLKEGLGLVLDLGSAQALTAVTFTATPGPITVELRAADSAAGALDGYTAVGGAVTATGATTIPASAGGSHRYWLIWVTALASSDGGYSVTIDKPRAAIAT